VTALLAGAPGFGGDLVPCLPDDPFASRPVPDSVETALGARPCPR
jgi:hypothetical protein